MKSFALLLLSTFLGSSTILAVPTSSSFSEGKALAPRLSSDNFAHAIWFEDTYYNGATFQITFPPSACTRFNHDNAPNDFMYKQASSVQFFAGRACNVYLEVNCQGDPVPMQFSENLAQVGLNDAIISWKCFS